MLYYVNMVWEICSLHDNDKPTFLEFTKESFLEGGALAQLSSGDLGVQVQVRK